MNKIKVFIADDSTIIRERLVAMITELDGFDIVGIAQTADETIGGVRKHKPDILILDMRLSGGDGFEVLQAVKQHQVVPLVIVLTNYPSYRQRCLKAGADYFFDKSVEFEQVIALLEKLKRGAGAIPESSA